ncbi:MAG TPA: TetR/AcrR family transcriptional regulator [Gemmataceae bacterium]|nr:TetR/AcrR family transcriptional regulator [Gemmataceae bacterium]
MTPLAPSRPIPATADRILDATERLLARFGYDKSTVDDIAQEAGVSKRTIYLHFAGKEAVALASIDRVVGRVTGRLREIAAGDGPPADRVGEMLVARVLGRFDSVRSYYQSLEDMFRSLRPAYLARRQKYFDAEAEVLAGVLDEGRRAKAFAVADPLATAHDLLVATNSLLPYSLSPAEFGRRSEVAARAERVARLLLDGLRKR